MNPKLILTVSFLTLWATPAHAAFVPINPCRAIDTLTSALPFTSGLTGYASIRAACELPETASAITYNATIVNAPAPGYVTLYSSDEARPVASALNFEAGRVQGNAGVIGLGTSSASELSVYIATAPQTQTVHLIMDVTGYHVDNLMAVAARASGERFTPNRWNDNGDGTATDRLTGLEWETKTDDGTVNDKDNVFTWSAANGAINESGTVYTQFLATLNTPPCFAGHCDWRLPTIDEVQALAEMDNTGSCVGTPCTFVPGHTEAAYYWSGTTSTATSSDAWATSFGTGLSHPHVKQTSLAARAVRP